MPQNYLWLNTGDRTGLSYSSGVPVECDCFDYLQFSFGWNNNTLVPAFTFEVEWFDIDGNHLYTDTFAPVGATDVLSDTIVVRGYSCQITFSGATGGSFTFWIFAKFIGS